ncbi:hypothetical protein GQ55_3G286100 [Panicum hallii var. hallii]|uniref:Uncharacterized protein n=1 Tax=Panicum hallii var. hallii TaxID=1504633 RepID=A0A2T7EEC4_9POAL|nr:hypothetical protein GQ55_3G286100 [Panicum hallii var. hallii]
MSLRGFGFTKTVLTTAVGAFAGYEEMVGAVKPSSIVVRLSRLWDGVGLPSSSGGGGGGGAEDRRLRQLEEKVRETEQLAAESHGDQQKLLAIIEDFQRRLDGPANDGYQHEFPRCRSRRRGGLEINLICCR